MLYCFKDEPIVNFLGLLILGNACDILEVNKVTHILKVKQIKIDLLFIKS